VCQSLKLFLGVGLTTLSLSQFNAQLRHAVPLLGQFKGHIRLALFHAAEFRAQFRLAVSSSADLKRELGLALSVSLLGRMQTLLPVAMLLTA